MIYYTVHNTLSGHWAAVFTTHSVFLSTGGVQQDSLSSTMPERNMRCQIQLFSLAGSQSLLSCKPITVVLFSPHACE